MMAIAHFDWLPSAAPQFAAALVSSLWQSTTLAAAVWLGLRFLPRISARIRFAVWLIAFLSAAMLPLLNVGFPAFAASSASTPTAASGDHALLQLDPGWAIAFLAAWLAAILAQLTILMWDVRGLVRHYRHSTPIPEEQYSAELRSILALGRRRAVQLRVSSRIDSPSVLGFFVPAILLPRWMHQECSAEQIKHVVLHELAHLRRHDDWVNMLQKLVRCANPLNPALYWMEKRLCFEREMACDDAVLAAQISAREYANCLVTLAGRKLQRREGSLAPGAMEKESDLGRRIRNILAPSRVSGLLTSRAVLAAFLLISAAGGAILSRCPQLIVFAHTAAPQPLTAARPNALSGPHLVNASFQLPHALAPLSHSSVQRLPPASPPPRTRARKQTFVPRPRLAIAPESRYASAQLPQIVPVSTSPTSAPIVHRQVWIVLTVWQNTPPTQLHDRPLPLSSQDVPAPVADSPAFQSWFFFQI